MTEVTERDKAYFNIFTTALEGGIGYWSRCSTYHWELPGGGEDVLNFYAVVTDIDAESGADGHRIDRDAIARGVRKYIEWAKDHPNGYFKAAAADLHWGNWDSLDVDADIADAIAQFGVLGELVYG